jgi:hypothetical protein
MFQHLLLHEPPKFTQIGIFGLKTNHLATPIVENKPSGNPADKPFLLTVGSARQ